MHPVVRRLLVVASLVVLAAASLTCRTARRDPGFLLGGIQVNEPDHAAWFEALVDEGMNAVSVTVYAKQGDWDTAHLWWSDEEPHVLAEIRGAKARGLAVVLIPRIALDHAFPRNVFLWHGMILPSDRERIEAWFERYREFVLRWAKVARDEDVDLFAVGSELSALTSTRPIDEIPPLAAWYLDERGQARRREEMLRRSSELDARDVWTRGRDDFDSLAEYLDAEIATHRDWALRTTFGAEPDAVARINARSAVLESSWRALIADVRKVYDGPLTYAANFDQYDRVGFWDALDRIGINAYWSLRPGGREVAPEDLPTALETGWESILGDIDAFRGAAGVGAMPVVFTEIGYTSRASGTVQPWAGTGFWLEIEERDSALYVWGDEPVRPDERVEAIRALDRVLRRREGAPLLDGLLWWKLSTLPGHREIEPFVAILGDPRDEPLFEALRSVAAGARARGARLARDPR